MGYETEIVATGIDKDVAEDILINMGYNVSISHDYTFSDSTLLVFTSVYWQIIYDYYIIILFDFHF